MSEPVIRWEYKLWDEDGKKIEITPKMEINEEETAKGVLGLLLWNKRVRKLDEDIEHSYIRAWFKEGGEPDTTLIDLDMAFKDGYFHYRGKFPITII